MTLPDPEQQYVLLADVLAQLDGFTAGGLTSPASIVDAIYEKLSAVEPRKVPEGGRRIVLEVHDTAAGDLRYIEATRNLSGVASLRWAIHTAAAELVDREGVARRMGRALGVDLQEARQYVDRDRDRMALQSDRLAIDD